MVAVILEERRHRRLNEEQSALIQQRVRDRTAQLESANAALAPLS